MTYLFILVLILYGIVKYDVTTCKEGKFELYIIIFTILIFISGFSYRLGGDGLHYLNEYNTYLTNDGFGWEALNKYDNRLPGWVLLTKICRAITTEYWLFKLVHAVIINILIAKTIKRYTSYIFLGLLMYYVLLYFDFNFQVLRQSLSVAIFLTSIPYFEENKWGKYYIINIIALLFHDATIFCLIFPFVKFLGYGKKALCFYLSIVLLFIIFSDNILIMALTSYTLDDSTAKLDFYAKKIELDVSFNFFYNLLLSLIIPYGFIYYFNKKRILDAIYPKQYMIIVYGVIYTIGLFVPILYRFNFFFILFFYLFYIDIFRYIVESFSRKFRFGKLKINFATCFIILTFLFTAIKARFYFSPYGETAYPTWVQYYPYSSIFFQNKDEKREEFFNRM